MEQKIKSEIQSLTSLVKAIESGQMVGLGVDDLKVIQDKRSKLVELNDLHIMLALEGVGIPAEIIMTKKQKGRFLKLVRIIMWWRRLFRLDK